MTGWMSVFLIAFTLITAAVILIRRVARRWWDYLLVVALAALLFWHLLTLVSGDVSRYLPAFLWSDGSDGKDQIIWASIASTFLLPLVLSALVLMIAKWGWRISRR
jgi:cytochrome c biogenesis protein CcdA